MFSRHGAKTVGRTGAQAVIEAIDKLYPDCRLQRESDLLRTARSMLVERHQQLAAEEQALAMRIGEVVEDLRAANDRVASWPLPTPGFGLIGPGIQKTYASTRSAFYKACEAPTDARFHETRKRVKYHWYQMRIVLNVWPDMLRAYRRSLKDCLICWATITT